MVLAGGARWKMKNRFLQSESWLITTFKTNMHDRTFIIASSCKRMSVKDIWIPAVNEKSPGFWLAMIIFFTRPTQNVLCRSLGPTVVGLSGIPLTIRERNVNITTNYFKQKRCLMCVMDTLWSLSMRNRNGTGHLVTPTSSARLRNMSSGRSIGAHSCSLMSAYSCHPTLSKHLIMCCGKGATTRTCLTKHR